MRYLILIMLATTLSASSLFCQNYLNGSEQWNEVGTVNITGTGTYENRLRTYRIDGDTTINGLVYHKIMYDGVDTTYNTGGDLVSTANHQNVYVAAIREEAKKFYHVYYDQSQEVLLHNFDLEIGDTAIYSNGNFIVDSIGLVDIGGGTMRKIFYSVYPFDRIIYEGIGATSGLFESPKFNLGPNNLLTCFLRDGYLLNLLFGPFYECGLLSNDTEVFDRLSVRIYPNPTKDFLNFLVNEPIPASGATIRIINIEGSLVKEFETDSFSSTFIVPVRDWASGVYWLQVVINDQINLSQKFIKT